jgi:hypothetical protein
LCGTDGNGLFATKGARGCLPVEYRAERPFDEHCRVTGERLWFVRVEDAKGPDRDDANE